MLCAIHKVDKDKQDKRGKYYHWVTGTKIMCYDNEDSTGYNVETKEKVQFPKPEPVSATSPAYQEFVNTGTKIKEEVAAKEEKPEEPMKRKDWALKDITEGFKALTYDHRKEDAHPVDAWDKTHLKEWMRAIYGDYDGYSDWEQSLELRLTELSK